MDKVRFILNGNTVEAKAGSTILEAAQQFGIDIPTLCHDPRLKPTTACRLCIVNVEGARGALPACSTPVVENMVVNTNTEDLVSSRKMALSLLLSDHYGDCVAPCKLACPAGIDVQGYVALIADGQYKEALKLIKETNPLPVVCGRVCPRFCEKQCRRNLLEGPVSINALKRFVADYDLKEGDPCVPEAKIPTGQKVAIIGGGPAGLTAAYYLALEGHDVSIFESGPRLGGMLRYGIPEYRLPKETLDREIAVITGLCHEVRCNVALGSDFTLESLKEEGFKAVFLALGAQASQKMMLEGEDLPGVLSGIGFLRDVVMGKDITLGRRIAVVGGGNTAIDAARTALRLGVEDVTIIYRRSRDEMPANDEEVEQAEEEGIHFQFLSNPVKIHAVNGRAGSVECIKMALGEPDKSGRRRPEPIPGSEFTMPVDTVIAAIGQTLDSAAMGKDNPLTINTRGFISINAETMETQLKGVFSGGDCASGPATVVEAIGAGHRAAISINQYLNGHPVSPPQKPYNCSKGKPEEIDISDYDNVERISRYKVTDMSPEERKKSFSEITPCFTEEMARSEAKRCLACGCQDTFNCRLRELATEYQVDDTRYAGRKRHLLIKENEHPNIIRDPNKCILCGRCVRICSEVQGVSAWALINRGFDTIVGTALDVPLIETSCESCGQCLSTCPTGALMPRIELPRPGPWKLKPVASVCPHCGIGCNLELNVAGKRLVNISSPVENPVNSGNLCKKGAFDPCSLNHLKRPGAPLIKLNGALVKTGWQEAIALAAKGLTQIRDKFGGNRIAVISSSRMTNEENYLIQKMARTALGTNNLGCLECTDVSETGSVMMKIMGSNASTCSFRDISSSDLILIYNCELAEDYPVIASRVRKAVADGSKLLSFNPRQTRLDSLAQLNLKVNNRTSAYMLDAMLSYILSYQLTDNDFINSRTTGFSNFARDMKSHPLENIASVPWVAAAKIIEAVHLYIRARNPVIIINADTITPLELDLISNLSLVTGNIGRLGAGIIALRTPGNAQGLIDMGVNPAYLPGQQSLANKNARQKFEAAWGQSLPVETGKDTGSIVQSVEKGEIKGILVARTDASSEMINALLELPLFSVLIDTVVPEYPPYPDIFLPGATFTESDGTYTNCERRIQRLHSALIPPAGKQNWQIIAALSAEMGYPMNYADSDGIYCEIAKLAPAYGTAGETGQWNFPENCKFEFGDSAARLKPAKLKNSEITDALKSLS